MNQESFSSFVGKWRFNETSEELNSRSVSRINKKVYTDKYFSSANKTSNVPVESMSSSKVSSKTEIGGKGFAIPNKQMVVTTRQASSIHKRAKSKMASRSRGATAQTSFLSLKKDKVLCSIFESTKGVSTRIEISFFNLNTGEMTVSEYVDSQIFIRTVHNLQIHDPVEIILPTSSLTPVPSKLCSVIKYNVPNNVKLMEAPSNLFDYKKGLCILENHCVLTKKEKSIKLQEFDEKDYGLAAMASCYYYFIEKDSNNCQSFSKIRLKYVSTEKTALIDPKTIKAIELVENLVRTGETTLLKFLDHTVTKMGKRMFRNNVLQPLTDKKSINMRSDAVESLLTHNKNGKIIDELRSILRECQDLDSMLTKLLSIDNTAICSNEKINFVIFLKTALEKSQKISDILTGVSGLTDTFQNELLVEIKQICNHQDLHGILSMVSTYINDDCTWAHTKLELQNQKTYAIKSGSNGLLDVSRNIYQSLIDEIMREVDTLKEVHDLNLGYHYEANRGFYLRLKKQEYGSNFELPVVFINEYKKNKSYIEFSTLKIIKLNARLFEVISEIVLISENIMEDLLVETVQYMPTLFMLSESFAMLDFLCSLGFHARISKDYCRPEFSDNKLFLQNARHPILEKTLKHYIANDVSSNKNAGPMTVITGCNSSGKSVYLKQIVFLSIMAQIGSYVPASFACLPIFSKIHCRLCSDSKEINSSTFATEMKEMAYFLNDVDSSTLLIIDELGRGSSMGDGFSICLSTVEYLINKKCSVFLSTHFNVIPQLMRAHPLVHHLDMKVDVDSVKSNVLKMTYKVQNNSAAIVSNYGLKVVSSFFPLDIINDSFRISGLFQRHNIFKQAETGILGLTVHKSTQIKQINNLISCLQELAQKKEQLSLDTLRDIQTQFILRFEND